MSARGAFALVLLPLAAFLAWIVVHLAPDLTGARGGHAQADALLALLVWTPPVLAVAAAAAALTVSRGHRWGRRALWLVVLLLGAGFASLILPRGAEAAVIGLGALVALIVAWPRLARRVRHGAGAPEDPGRRTRRLRRTPPV